METLIGWIILIGIFVGFGRLFGWFTSGVKATYKAATEGTSIIDNFKEENYQMGHLEARVVEGKEKFGDTFHDVFNIQLRGLINPTEHPYNLQCVVSLFDVTGQTSGEKIKYNKPILTIVPEIMEPATRTFQLKWPMGQVNGLNGYNSWQPVHRILPMFLIGQKKGIRSIRGLVRFVPDDPSVLDEIEYGLGPNKDTLITTLAFFDFKAKLTETGYEEARDNYFKIRSHCVQFGVLMAFSDGELDPLEGNIIKKWIAHQIDIETDGDKEKLKTILNETLKKSYENAKAGNLSIDKLVAEFKKITTKANTVGMLEFLFEIIGADGNISDSELKVVNSIGSKLDVSKSELKAMTDKTFLNNKTGDMEKGNSAENILGITDDMTKNEIKVLLNNEFKKWNGRIQALEDGEEKEKAQTMLNVIAEARKKYG